MELGLTLLLGFMAGFPGAIKLLAEVLERIKGKGNKDSKTKVRQPRVPVNLCE